MKGAAAETSWLGIGLTAGTLLICPWLGRAKQRVAQKLGSRATYGEGTQNAVDIRGAVCHGIEMAPTVRHTPRFALAPSRLVSATSKPFAVVK